MLLRPLLGLADRIVAALPARTAYALADLAGNTWYRLAPVRRRLVAANLARVCAATGAPTRGPRFRRLVRRAFVEHARYYLELLRAPHYPSERIDEHVTIIDWAEHEATLRGGAAVIVSPHLGNFEPMGAFFAAHGLPVTSPVEEIEPPELYEFIRSRRGAGRGVELVPLKQAARPVLAALRRGEIAGIIADRDLEGDGLPITLFGHPTTLPMGPAQLVVTSGAAFIAGSCLRIGPDLFRGMGERIPYQSSGDRRADAERLTRAMAMHFERLIALAPEQWWGSFQTIWPDVAPGGSPDSTIRGIGDQT